VAEAGALKLSAINRPGAWRRSPVAATPAMTLRMSPVRFRWDGDRASARRIEPSVTEGHRLKTNSIVGPQRDLERLGRRPQYVAVAIATPSSKVTLVPCRLI
jgi:hypothetical protein